DAIFDENRFSSVPRPSLSIPKGTEAIGGLVVPEVVTNEVVQQPKSELRKSKMNRTLKDFGPEFQLYLIKGTRDEVSDQHSYCFNVEDDPKTFDEMNSIMGNNTWVLVDLPLAFLNDDLDEEVYMNQPQGFIVPGNENKVDLIKEFLSSSTPMDTCEKLMPNNGQAVSQLEYSRVISCLMYAMTCTRPHIAFDVGKLSRLTYIGYPLVLGGYIDSSWISNTKDNSSTSGWVFLLDGGVISWASKKQIYITGSIIESEFVALAVRKLNG
ncbi:hypothetical protein Tco_1462332, partial [Tanacetum coccineum]